MKIFEKNKEESLDCRVGMEEYMMPEKRIYTSPNMTEIGRVKDKTKGNKDVAGNDTTEVYHAVS